MKTNTQSSSGNRTGSSGQRVAIVTGAGEGLGREMALTLAAKGYQVYGTALFESEVTELDGASNGTVKLTITDVTNEAAVQNFAANVQSAIGGNGIDVLISNVGILTPGPMETLTIDQLRHEFEVDVFGAVRIINTFLPKLRQAKGKIIAISSYSGKFAVPFSGPSSATKATLEALADAYRTELRPFGVDFIVAEPGNMLTKAPAKSAAAIKRTLANMPEELKEIYGDAFLQFERAFNGLQDAGLPADTAARMIVDLLNQEPAPARVPIGVEAARVIRIAHDRSDAELDDIRIRFLGLDKLPVYADLLNKAPQKDAADLDPGIAVVRRNTEEVQGKGDYKVFEELFALDFLDHTPQPGGFGADREGAKALYKKLR